MARKADLPGPLEVHYVDPNPPKGNPRVRLSFRAKAFAFVEPEAFSPEAEQAKLIRHSRFVGVKYSTECSVVW